MIKYLWVIGFVISEIINVPIKRFQGQWSDKAKLIQDVLIPRSDSLHKVSLSTNDIRRYYVEISLGTPPQVFKLALDTGSHQLMIFSKECSNFISDAVPETYDSSRSLTFIDLNRRSVITYGNGFGLGCHVNQDTFRLGDLEVLNQEFGEVNMVFNVESMSTLQFQSGILGMAPIYYDKNEHPGPAPLLASIFNQTKWVFAVRIENWKQDGVLTIGGFDESLPLDEIKYFPLHGEEFWEIKFNSINIGDKKVSTKHKAFCTMLDTGACTLAFPEEITKEIFKLIGAKYDPNLGIYSTVPCGNGAPVYAITLAISGSSITIKPTDYLVKVTTTASGQSMCAVLITSLNEKPKDKGCVILILGLPFFRRHYTIFDLENRKIGIARIAPMRCSEQFRKSRNCHCRIL